MGSAIEDIVKRLLTSFRSASPEEREAATAALSSQAKLVLSRYAWTMAEEAVRRNSKEMVTKGLTALAVENGPSDDPRHEVVIIAVLFRSAQKLGLDTTTIFSDAAALVSNPWLRECILTFPSRVPENRDLEKAFYVHESFDKDGFRYERGPWTMRRRLWEQLRRLFI
jgi:hypothetical protein